MKDIALLEGDLGENSVTWTFKESREVNMLIMFYLLLAKVRVAGARQRLESIDVLNATIATVQKQMADLAAEPLCRLR